MLKKIKRKKSIKNLSEKCSCGIIPLSPPLKKIVADAENLAANIFVCFVEKKKWRKGSICELTLERFNNVIVENHQKIIAPSELGWNKHKKIQGIL